MASYKTTRLSVHIPICAEDATESCLHLIPVRWKRPRLYCSSCGTVLSATIEAEHGIASPLHGHKEKEEGLDDRPAGVASLDTHDPMGDWTDALGRGILMLKLACT